MATSILLVDPDPSTAAWLKALLAREGYRVETAVNSGAALAAIQQNPPDAIILERDLPAEDGLMLIPDFQAAAPGAPILILSARANPDDVIAGLDAGAYDYIPKRPGADVELISKMRGLFALTRKTAPTAPTSPTLLSPAHESRGKIFSFISAKGGTGTTSVCINTASALAKLEPRAEIILVDMVFPIGTIGASIGFETRETVAKLSHLAKGNIDRATLEKFVSPYQQRYGFRMLIGANDPQESANLEVSQIVPLFETLLQMFDYVFVDFGRGLSRISLPVLECSNTVVIILTPDANTVRMTKLTLAYIESLGVLSERIVLINNRTMGRVWISKEDTERELNLALTATIPFEQEYFTMAINSGVPFFNKFPEHAAALMFTDVARLLKERVSR